MPPRTNSCAICRKKRIKCDATLPQCLMCVRTGRECPGPLRGPVFIDMTASASSKKRSKNTSSQRGNNHKHLSYGQQQQPIPEMARQVSQRYMINEAFYANFLCYFTSDGEGKDIQNKMTWLHRLPYLSSDGTNAALTMALQATASAFCGVETANIAVVRDACNLYGRALNLHARILSSHPKEVTVHMVSTSVVLSLFEAMQATTADAYREHINGAAKMLEVTGPGQCMEGVLCQLFFHIRTQMAFVYLTTERAQPLSVRKILTESLLYRRLPVFQRLMSHIATLAEMYVNKTSANSKQQLISLSIYQSVRADVDSLWLEYKESASEREENLFWHTPSGKTEFRDGFTALCIAYFSAARILFSVLAPRLAATYPEFEDHFGRILACADYLESRKIGCAYMRMATPLYLVTLHSPIGRQRSKAMRIFEDWKKGSMAGISALALDTIQKRQDHPLTLDDSAWPEELVSAQKSYENLPLEMFRFEDWVGQV